MQILASWYRFARRMESKAEDGFEGLGRNVGRHPKTYILAVTLFTILCSIGFMNYSAETDGSKLWVPSNTRAQKDSAYIQDKYGKGFRSGSVLYAAQPSIDNNLINLDAFEQMWDVHDNIVNNVNGAGFTWEEACGIRDSDGNCATSGPLQFFYSNRTYYNSVVKTLADLRTAVSADKFPTGQLINRDLIFGKYVINTTTDEIISAEGTTTVYSIGLGTTASEEWEQSFIDVMKIQEDGYVDIYYFASRSFGDVFGAAIFGDVQLLMVAYLLMLMITCFVLAKRYDSVGSRVGLSMCGILVIILSMAAGYGLCSGFGVKFVPLHQVLPFVVVGIGVDDMFIIVASFDAQDEELETSERLAKGLRRCGISITYTTATDVIAFLLGSVSSLPAIEAFCYYAAVTLLFNFCFQVTMFSAILCMDADRMNSKKCDFFCCFPACCCLPASLNASPVTDSSDSNDPSKQVEMISVGDNENDDLGDAGKAYQQVVTTEPDNAGADGAFVGGGTAGVGVMVNDKANVTKQTFKELNSMQLFFRDRYAPFITTPWVRVVVVLLFAGMLGACIYGSTQLTQGFDFIDFAPDGSYVRDYFQVARSLNMLVIEQNTPVQIVYKDVDYYTQSNQEEMLRIQEDFLDGRHNKGPFTSWVEEFVAWVPTNSSPYNASVNAQGYLTNSSVYYHAVEYFVNQPDYSRFDRDVKFVNSTPGDASTLSIDTSRVSAYHIDMDTASHQISGMTYARDVVDDSSIDPTPIVFASSYVRIETELVIVGEMIFNLVYALVAVVVVSLFVLIRPSAVLLVGLFVAMIDVDLLGMMFFWELQVNNVTVVQLVMAVGLVVDYVSHVMHYYLQQSYDKTPNERLSDALVEIGPSVMLGCTTTFVGVLPLAVADSIIFRAFFKMFFLIIVLGGSHGLVLLPAVLPLIPFEDISSYTTLDDSDKRVKPVNAKEMEEEEVGGGAVSNQQQQQQQPGEDVVVVGDNAVTDAAPEESEGIV